MPLNRLSPIFTDFLLLAKDCRFFFDFDNTITRLDVVDEIIKNFSIDDAWMELEDDWCEGRISAKECLTGQLARVRVSQKKLDKFLAGISFDEGFYPLLGFLRENGIEPTILSDNFKPVIERILSHQGIKDIKIYANELKFDGDRVVPSFPYTNLHCPYCAHCKKTHLIPDRYENKSIVYVGDGRSDLCAAEVSDIVFAKDRLAEYLLKRKRDFIPYKDLSGIMAYLKERWSRPSS